ncbi:hypothetical protein [Chitinophaga pinensis]|uniref:hypothetical protein n=1 Tax=Chitinophaga pinensis TaxID=79329 RepID=UPI0021BD2509|nr:hypothetical protein [Chitinophaga pinensis]
MIAYWPKGIKAKGAFADQLGHVMDFMPTFLSVAKASYPQTYKGHNITPTTGISLLPAFEGKQQAGMMCCITNILTHVMYVRVTGNWCPYLVILPGTCIR